MSTTGAPPARSRRRNNPPSVQDHAGFLLQPAGTRRKATALRQRNSSPSLFLQLLGRGYTDSQGHLRRFFIANYGDVLETFVGLVHQAQPELPASEIFWRLHFTLGTVVFTMASSEALIDISDVDFKQKTDIEGVIKRIIPYVAAGVAAPMSR